MNLNNKTTITLIFTILIHCYLFKKYVKKGDSGEFLSNDSIKQVSGYINKETNPSILYRTDIGDLLINNLTYSIIDNNNNYNDNYQDDNINVQIYISKGSILPLSLFDFTTTLLVNGTTNGGIISSGSGFYLLVTTNSIKNIQFNISLELNYSSDYILNYALRNCILILISLIISISFIYLILIKNKNNNNNNNNSNNIINSNYLKHKIK